MCSQTMITYQENGLATETAASLHRTALVLILLHACTLSDRYLLLFFVSCRDK